MSDIDLKQALLKTSLCKYLDIHEVDKLIDFSRLVNFSAGDILLRQGSKSQGILVIVEGQARVSAQVLGEGAYNITALNIGNLVGEISMTQHAPSTTTIVADTPMICLFIAENYFDTLSTFFPETKFKISKVILEEICKRLKEMHAKIISYMQHSNMTARSFLSDLLGSFVRETETPLHKTHLSREFLQKQELFDRFSIDELDYILQHAVITEAPANCPLIRENHSSPLIYFVIRGAVQSSVVEKNIVAKLSVLGPISIFGYMTDASCASQGISFFTCERAVLLKISQKQLDKMQEEKPKAWYKIYDFITQSFAGLEQAANKLDVRLHSEHYNR